MTSFEWRRHVSLRRGFAVAALVFAWCALWERVSVANVLSGLVVAMVVLVLAGPPADDDGPGWIRPIPLLRFLGLVAADMARSTVGVAHEVLTPTDYTDESIVAVDLPSAARRHRLLLIVAVTVTPGTAVVDTDAETGALYLHLLHHERADDTLAHVRRLAELACAALPTGPTAKVAP